MNDWEKQKLREHWQKPGRLKALLGVLSMTPHNSGELNNNWYKQVVWMTGIGFEPTEMAQVYYMLEEDDVLVRDGEPPAPAAYLECTHPGVNKPCHQCHFEIFNRGKLAAIRYKLAKPLDQY